MDTRTLSKRFGTCAFALVASCTNPDNVSQRIAITEPNALGVRSIEVSRSEDTFALRGLTASYDEVASVRLRIGEVDDLADITGKPRIGSEIVLAAQGEQTRIVSRETQLFRLPPSNDAALQLFLQLAPVASALETAHIVVRHAPAAGGGESAYADMTCPAHDLNTSPVADQCCYTEALTDYPYPNTYFVAASGAHAGNIIYRETSTNPPCTSISGGSCNGAGCYWGPDGFARASIVTGSGTPRVTNVGSGGNERNNQDYCQALFYASGAPPIAFSNVTGTFATGQGCPGSSSGDDDWDY
jgi:hypothetical protein